MGVRGRKGGAGGDPEEALVRECREELDIRVAVGEPFMEVIHAYPDLTVHLTLFHASIAEGTPRKLEHQDIRWIRAAEIPQYRFWPRRRGHPGAAAGSGRMRRVPHRLEDKTRPAPEWRWP